MYCRIRPLGSEDEECCVEMISSTTIQLHAPDGLKANRNGEYKEVSVFYKNVKQAGHSYLISIPPLFHELSLSLLNCAENHKTILNPANT